MWPAPHRCGMHLQCSPLDHKQANIQHSVTQPATGQASGHQPREYWVFGNDVWTVRYPIFVAERVAASDQAPRKKLSRPLDLPLPSRRAMAAAIPTSMLTVVTVVTILTTRLLRTPAASGTNGMDSVKSTRQSTEARGGSTQLQHKERHRLQLDTR